MKPIYVIPTLSHALDVLEDLQSKSRGATLEVLSRETRVSRTSTYRILKTLEQRGYVRHVGGYFHCSSVAKKKRVFGLLSRPDDVAYFRAFNDSIRKTAGSNGSEVVECLSSDELTIRSWVRNLTRCDVVIANGLDATFAPFICDEIFRAGIAMISVDSPQPHATYLGIDDYRAGSDAGALLASHARENWAGRIDNVVGLLSRKTDHSQKVRIDGAFQSIREAFPALDRDAFTLCDTRGSVEKGALSALQPELKNRCILVVASTEDDVSVALDALQALKTKVRLAIIEVGPFVDGLKHAAMKTSSNILGCVGADVSCYGPRIMELASDLFIGNPARPYNCVPHTFFQFDDCVFSDHEKMWPHREDPETAKDLVSQSYATIP